MIASRTLQMLPGLLVVVCVASFGSLAACRSEERAEATRTCNDSIHGGRLDVKNGDLAAARAKLTLADRSCPDIRRPYVEDLRKAIDAKRLEMTEARARAAAEAERRREHPVVPFMDWVAREVSATKRETADMRCYERTSPLRGFCERSVDVIDGNPFEVRFWKLDTDAVRFGVAVRDAVSCEELGAHRVVRRWTTDEGGPSAQRLHCELLSKAHRGLAALVTTTAEGTRVDVFTRSYLDRDGDLAETLRLQGR